MFLFLILQLVLKFPPKQLQNNDHLEHIEVTH